MKTLFSLGYLALAAIASLTSLWQFAISFHLAWLGALMTALPPMINRVWAFDRTAPVQHKVKVPRVSAMVLAGLALELLTVPERGLSLWLALGCTGGFLLDTYWARA